MTLETQKYAINLKQIFFTLKTLKKLYHIRFQRQMLLNNYSNYVSEFSLSFKTAAFLFLSFYETSHKRINDILKTESKGPLEALLNQSLTNKHFHFRSGTQFRGIF